MFRELVDARSLPSVDRFSAGRIGHRNHFYLDIGAKFLQPDGSISKDIMPDFLHPNDAGYAFIAAEVVKAITGSSYPAPQSSCTGMTIVP